MSALRNPDVRLGVFLIVAAGAWTFALVPTGIDMPGRVGMMAVAPDFWPTICGYMLMIVGTAIAVRGSIQRTPDARPTTEPDVAESIRLPTRPAAARVAVAVAVIFVYYLGLDWLGMPLASALAFLALSLLAGERRYGRVIAIAVALPVVLFVFFSRIAHVPIPLGITDGLI